jgi:hypothetical protein
MSPFDQETVARGLREYLTSYILLVSTQFYNRPSFFQEFVFLFFFFLFFFFTFWFLEIGFFCIGLTVLETQSVDQAILELAKIYLPLISECWD